MFIVFRYWKWGHTKGGGHTLHGPFDTKDEANKWIDEHKDSWPNTISTLRVDDLHAPNENGE